jgi:hypothetical protein
MIQQHWTDEARHYGYFLGVFPEVWRRWPAEERRIVARLIPWMLVTLLSTDIDPIARDLQRFGLDPETAATVARTAHCERPSMETLLESGRGCFAMLRRAGLMGDASLRQGFAVEGFAL